MFNWGTALSGHCSCSLRPQVCSTKMGSAPTGPATGSGIALSQNERAAIRESETPLPELLALSSRDYQFPLSITSPVPPLLGPFTPQQKIPAGLCKQAAMAAIFRFGANALKRGPGSELKHFGPCSRCASSGTQLR